MKHAPILLLSAALLAASPLSPILPNACAQSAAKETAEPHERTVDVFVAGDGNEYKSIRIPDIINAGGVLVAMAEGRYDNTDQGRNDLIVSTSRDGGLTWSKPTVAASSEGATFNNPCLIYDEEAKHIVLFFQRYPAGVHERDKNIPTGHEDERCIRNFVCFSKRGKKWSTPKDVTEFTKNEGVTITCSGPNPGVQIKHGEHKGRLVVPLNEGPFGNWTVAAAYSDDHGKTWNIGKKSAAGMGINEVSIAETDDGGLVVVSRAWGGNQRKIVYSQDGGESWGEITSHPQLPSPNTQNGMARYSFEDEDQLGNKSRLIFSTPTKGRSDGTIKMSYDNGKTWDVEKLIIPGPFAYSTLTPVSPGIMGILYELNHGNCITHLRFTTFSIDWLTDGEDSGVGKGVKVRKSKKPKKSSKADKDDKADKNKKDKKDKKDKKARKDKKKSRNNDSDADDD